MSSAGLWPLPLPSLLCSLPSGWGRRKGQGSNWTVPRAPYLSQTAYCETNNCSKNCSGAYVIPWRALTGVRHPQIPDAGHLQLFDILLELPSEGSTLQTHALWTPSLMVHLVFFRLLLCSTLPGHVSPPELAGTAHNLALLQRHLPTSLPWGP